MIQIKLKGPKTSNPVFDIRPLQGIKTTLKLVALLGIPTEQVLVLHNNVVTKTILTVNEFLLGIQK